MFTLLQTAGNGDFYFKKLLNIVYEMIAGEGNSMCSTTETDGITGVIAWVVNFIFIGISLLYLIVLIKKIFLGSSSSSGKKDEEGEQGKGSTDDGEFDSYFEKVKENAKKNLLGIIGLILFVFTGLATKTCSA